jgi:predicted outer membrane repeat protein
MTRGGGLSIDYFSNPIFIDCVFENNVSDGKGGAIYDDFGCSPLLENCLFVDNIAQSGSAMGNDGASNPTISHTTFYGNDASEVGAALYQGTGPYNDPTVIDTIIWSNYCAEDVSDIYNWNECNTKVTYSIVEEGYEGEGVIEEDPQFVDAENNKFDLEDTSPALTAGHNGERIGFDSSLINERTDEDYKSLIEYLYTIEKNEEPTAMDLTNPVEPEEAASIGTIVYVKVDGSGNGSSWADAFGSLQEGIDYANAAYILNGDEVEVWVAEGTYLTGNERSDAFILREGVSVYGGFEGTESSLASRDYKNNETILSGDIGVQDDATDNSYHVVIGSDNATIDGFTITKGYADGSDGGEVYDNKGGGLLNYYAGNRVIPHYEPTLGYDTVINNCIFEENYAVEGGATYTYHGGNPEYTNCTFEDNTADYGGATVDRAGTNAIYLACSFEDNTATYKGGAAFTDYGAMATFEDCIFEGNESGTAGGAIYVIDRASQAVVNETDFDLIDPSWELLNDIYSSVLVMNSTFEDNEAGTNGGAIYVYENSFAKVVNTIFKDNDADAEGDDIGIFYKSTLYIDDTSTTKGIYIGERCNLINE